VKSLIISVVLLSILVILGAVYWVGQAPAPTGLKVGPSVTVVDHVRALPEFRLAATSREQEFTRESLLGHWTYLTFGYTHCPDVCPSTLTILAQVTQKMGDRKTPLVVFVSVDQPRDSIELLKQYVPGFYPSFLGATGDDAALQPLTKALGVYYVRNAPEKGSKGYSVDHSSAVYLITPEGKLRAAFSMPMDAAQMAKDTTQLMTHY
jgi:protein SCO1/2